MKKVFALLFLLVMLVNFTALNAAVIPEVQKIDMSDKVQPESRISSQVLLVNFSFYKVDRKTHRQVAISPNINNRKYNHIKLDSNKRESRNTLKIYIREEDFDEAVNIKTEDDTAS